MLLIPKFNFFKKINRLFLILLALTFLLKTEISVSIVNQCSKIFNKNSSFNLTVELLSFGLEVEYSLERSKNILSDYKLRTISDSIWIKLSYQEKIELINKSKSEVARYGLIKLKNAPNELPNNLSKEPHGTFEISDLIFKTKNELFKYLDFLELRYGVGATQAHIVLPENAIIMGLSSYVAFSSEKAQLRNLENGYKKWLNNNEKLPGQNLIHFALPPLSLKGLKENEKIEEDFLNHSDTLKRNNMKGKYFYSSVLRTGIYGGKRIGIELRQFNYDTQLLREEVDFIVHKIETNNVSSYTKYKNNIVSTTDIVSRIESEYSIQTNAWFSFFNAKSDKGYTNIYLLDIFLFPLRPWSSHAVLSNLDVKSRALKISQIKQAEIRYINSLSEIISKSKTVDSALPQLRVSMAQWAHEVNLSSYFK